MNDRWLVFAGGYAVAVVLTVAAVWLIVTSPGTIDEVDPYSPGAVPVPGETVTVRVNPGEAPRDIADKLHRAGVIDSPRQFSVLVGLLGYDRVLQAGDYDFQQNTSALEALYRIRRGIVSTRSVTVIEGWRLEEIADAVAAQGVPRDAFIGAAVNEGYNFAFLEVVPPGGSLEGFLFPATYPIRADDDPRDIVERMLQAFADNVPPDLRQGHPNLGLDFRDSIILASIIEREAQVRDEAPVMAQVFLSRLAIGMPLEADPTVQYAVAEDPASVAEHGYWKQGLTLDDLATDSLYNTYVYGSLPPSPISNPGIEAIIAAVQPADTDYLYFVARPDGSHAFASTFEEHLENVERYQR